MNHRLMDIGAHVCVCVCVCCVDVRSLVAGAFGRRRDIHINLHLINSAKSKNILTDSE